MIQYIALILMAMLSSVQADEFLECGYIPKEIDQHQYPQWELFTDCASYKEGVLKIVKEHMANFNFRTRNTVHFFTSEQHFYLKPDGRFLPVLFYDNGADSYQEGLTRSLRNAKVAYFNRDFELVIAPGYDWAWPFQAGRALVCNGCVVTPAEGAHTILKGGMWGFINRQGEEVVPVKYTATDVSRK